MKRRALSPLIDPSRGANISIDLTYRSCDLFFRSIYYILCENAREKISLSIKDTGPGIVKADQDKIFEPFYSTKANGSGLGLSIVKRIADSNNWILEVKSDMKSGTEFLLAIPVISS